MKLVSWKCRGLGSKFKVEAMKDIIRAEKPNVLLVQETKLSNFDLMSLNKIFWPASTGVAVSSRGASGGLATF
jgi:exonuclease III